MDTLGDLAHYPRVAPLDGIGHDWALVRVRIGKAFLLLGPIYLTSGMGFNGENSDKVHQLTQCLNYYEAYHHVIGDLNAEPSEWPPTLSKEMRTQIVVPQGTSWTCNQGQMRIIDYSFSSKVIAPTVSLIPDWFSPTSPHIGLWGTLTARPQTQLGRKLIPPKEFPFIEVHNQEQDRKQEEARQKKIQKAVATLTKRLQAWLTKYAPLEDHTAILDNPNPTAISEQHPQVESYLEIILAMQEARLGVSGALTYRPR